MNLAVQKTDGSWFCAKRKNDLHLINSNELPDEQKIEILNQLIAVS